MVGLKSCLHKLSSFVFKSLKSDYGRIEIVKFERLNLKVIGLKSDYGRIEISISLNLSKFLNRLKSDYGRIEIMSYLPQNIYDVLIKIRLW